jgi:hypothetical protein
MIAQATRLQCAQTKPLAFLRTRSPIACHGFTVPGPGSWFGTRDIVSSAGGSHRYS